MLAWIFFALSLFAALQSSNQKATSLSYPLRKQIKVKIRKIIKCFRDEKTPFHQEWRQVRDSNDPEHIFCVAFDLLQFKRKRHLPVQQTMIDALLAFVSQIQRLKLLFDRFLSTQVSASPFDVRPLIIFGPHRNYLQNFGSYYRQTQRIVRLFASNLSKNMPVKDHLLSFGGDFYSFTFFLYPWPQILAIFTLFLDLIEKGLLEEVA